MGFLWDLSAARSRNAWCFPPRLPCGEGTSVHKSESQTSAEAQPSAGSWCGGSLQGILNGEMRLGGLVRLIHGVWFPAAARRDAERAASGQALSPEHGCKLAKQPSEHTKPLHWREDACGRPPQKGRVSGWSVGGQHGPPRVPSTGHV